MTGLRYGSVCSGIEAVTCAWHPLGFAPQWFAEIAPFPSAVLGARWPGVSNLGDFTRIGADVAPIDVLVGGTPCQSFSVAGLRGGLDDDRGNLALEFLRLAQRTRARWVVWENVPGVLSSGGGRDFGSILGALGELGYGFAYRILDAQYVGVPQRRRRVFVVGYLGDWRRAAAVLFERHGLSWDPPPSREAGARVAAAVGAQSASGRGWRLGADEAAGGQIVAALSANGVGASGPDDNQAQAGHFIACGIASEGERERALTAHSGRYDLDTETFVAHTLRGKGHDASEDGARRGAPLVACTAFNASNYSTGEFQAEETARGLTTSADRTRGAPIAITGGVGVRRLTPRECERLQGFPDDYTLVEYRGKPAADGPRYEAIGNSMAVPVLRWIGRRLAMVKEGATDAA